MSDKKIVFSQEIELSEIVLEKTGQAFEMIQKEELGAMKKTDTKGTRSFKAQAAAVAGVCILAVSGMSAAAAIHHYWGRGMNGNIRSSEEQQQALTEKDIAKVYREEPESASLSVTENGITIKPDTVVVDERYAYMSFSISGYHVGDGMEPGFGRVNVYLGNDPEDEDAWVDMTGTMYDGIISDENGAPVYEDGTPVAYSENGSMICHYADSDGTMEYIIQASVADKDGSLLGKTIHVGFEDLGILSKADFTLMTEGDWDLEIELPDVSSSQDIKVGQKVEGTGFTMEDISISPISMKVDYSVDAAPAGQEDDLGIPEVRGVILKDGTRISYLTGGATLGYTDSSRKRAYQIAGYDRVIDVDAVAALIVLTPYENEGVEIPISR